MSICGYTVDDIQRYYDSIPPGDVDYGHRARDYPGTIYRDIADGKGFIELYASPEGPGIASVAISVHPAYRRKGVASQLISRAKANMEKLGMERLEWYCCSLASLKTAQKNGFTVDESLSNDGWYTLIYMVRPDGKGGETVRPPSRP